MKKLAIQRCLGLGVLCMSITLSALAQDSCSVDTVIQPAIDAAAAANSCNAPGQYVTASDLISQAVDKAKNCAEAKKRAENLLEALKNFSKLKISLFPATNVKQLLSGAVKNKCKGTTGDNPTGGNPGGGNNGDGNGTPGNGGNTGGGDDHPTVTPTPGTSPTPKPSPTPKAIVPLTVEQVIHVINEHCNRSGQTFNQACCLEVTNYVVPKYATSEVAAAATSAVPQCSII